MLCGIFGFSRRLRLLAGSAHGFSSLLVIWTLRVGDLANRPLPPTLSKLSIQLACKTAYLADLRGILTHTRAAFCSYEFLGAARERRPNRCAGVSEAVNRLNVAA